MTPELIHSVWKLIERSPYDALQCHDPEAFADSLITQLQESYELETSQIKVIRAYIRAKIPLVCELNERGQFSKYPYLSA